MDLSVGRASQQSVCPLEGVCVAISLSCSLQLVTGQRLGNRSGWHLIPWKSWHVQSNSCSGKTDSTPRHAILNKPQANSSFFSFKYITLSTSRSMNIPSEGDAPHIFRGRMFRFVIEVAVALLRAGAALLQRRWQIQWRFTIEASSGPMQCRRFEVRRQKLGSP